MAQAPVDARLPVLLRREPADAQESIIDNARDLTVRLFRSQGDPHRHSIKNQLEALLFSRHRFFRLLAFGDVAVVGDNSTDGWISEQIGRDAFQPEPVA